MIDILTVDGDRINRCEIFDEADLDAALARFDELQPTGTAAGKRGKPGGRALPGATSGRDWDAMAEILADDICH